MARKKSKRQELNERIEALCRAKGLTFRPWQVTPWDVDERPSPWGLGSAGTISWPKAQRLRRELIAEIKAQESVPNG
jgi:hypothetical protein